MLPLSVTVITRDESAHIADALASVRWADDIVVVDSNSTDDTAAIARQFTDRVVLHQWEGYSAQKNYAAGLARFDWILSLDADERVTPELAEEIARRLAAPGLAGYRIPRASYYLGRWLRSTDWYPDYQLRLYDRRRGRWTGEFVHESVVVDGDVRRFRAEMLHYPYRDISHHLQTIDRYTGLAAREMFRAGRRATLLDLAVRPPLAFLRNYVLRHGFTDGGPGFVVSLLNSGYVLVKFAKLWEMGRRTQQEPCRD